MDINPGKFMVAVGAIIENVNTGKILLLKRSTKVDFSGGIWEQVTGRMHQFEDPVKALKREVKEETGIADLKIIKPLTINHFFRGEKTADKEIILIIFRCQTRQAQVKISSEHVEHIWLSPTAALKLVKHPGVKKDIEVFNNERVVSAH